MSEGPQDKDQKTPQTESDAQAPSDVASGFPPPPPPPPPTVDTAEFPPSSAAPFQPGYAPMKPGTAVPGSVPPPAPTAKVPQVGMPAGPPPVTPLAATAPMPPSPSPQFPPASMPAPPPGSPGVAPVAPGMPPAAVPTPPSAFVMALKNLWSVMNSLWRGKFADAFEPSAEAVRATGSKWANWVVPFLASSLAGAILFIAWASSAARGALSASGLGFFMPAGPYLAFRDYVQIFLLLGLVTFGVLALRAVAVMFAVRVTGGNISFPDAATILGVGQTLMWLPMLTGVLLTFILGVTPLSLLLTLGLAGVGLMVELVTYVGVTRLGEFKFSPLVPYVWFTVLAYVVAFLVIAMIGDAILG